MFCAPPDTAILVETSPAANRIPAAMPQAGPPPIRRARSLTQRTRGDRGGHEPHADPDVAGAGALAVLAEQGEAEQREADDRDHDADPLTAGQRHVREPRDHDREDPDPAGGGRLHERERRERERDDVEDPAERLGAESREPAAVREQRVQRGDRPCATTAAAASRRRCARAGSRGSESRPRRP